jgi:hypothetical protein
MRSWEYVLYRAPISASQQMANSTPEQAKAGMDAWMDWANKASSAILDLGAPLGDGRSVSGVSAEDGSARIVGYSLLQAESIDVATQLLQKHPQGRIPNFSIEIFECLQMPAEAAKQPSRAA